MASGLSNIVSAKAAPAWGALLFGILLIGLSSQIKWHVEPRRFTPPPPVIRYFHFGYKETMADLFWVRVVQDFSVCEKAADSDVASNVGAICNKGWVFQMLDLVTDLAPNFKMPYYYGATNLSVLVNDAQGAKIIFDKGLVQMPESWDVAYRAAYHYLIELKNKERAAELLIQAGKNGAPSWVFGLAAKLYTEEGKAFLAKTVLSQMLSVDPNGPHSERLRQRLKQAEDVLEKSKKSP